ncbi:hypothetical protein ACSNOK_03905 [Streptomyces sp. URMC 126]|uniref:golvesin C-terminal-like domain-containing protein n=2 Tax=Actinomycetes TaxID=1760 RepID=UPI003F1D44BC
MRRHRRSSRAPALLTATAVSAAAATVAALLQGPTAWAGPPAAEPRPERAAASPATVAPAERDAVLGKGWNKSTDRAWTTAGDATGLHLLVAEGRSGYTWRTAATLSEPGLQTDQWIGNACVTASGRRAVVVYAPRGFTNRQHLFDRGAFTAVVDLESGKVNKLPLNASLAYFDPGCGSGETAVITQAAAEGAAERTQLQTVDAVTGKVVATNTVNGQATSAVPTGDGVVAASGPRLLRLAPSGRTELLATTGQTPLRLRPDGQGGVTFLEPADARSDKALVRHLKGRKVSTVADGRLGDVGLAQGSGGTVFLTGGSRPRTGGLPKSVRRLPDVPGQAELSGEGRLAITQAVPRHLAKKVAAPLSGTMNSGPEPVDITAKAVGTGKGLGFSVDTSSSRKPADSRRPSPVLPYVVGGTTATRKALAAAGKAAPGDISHNPVDDERYCSVPRNDAKTQVLQPTPNQVEWAVDMAIRGLLISGNINRPANWHNSGLPAWTPQGMFPPRTLSTGGRIPAQVMLGILAQESNLWQATSHAEPGEYGNPLIGNFYGTNIYAGTKGYDPKRIWKVNWDKADCGYGIGQATDGMRIAGHPKPHETLLPPDQQRAVALDYATGISYSVRILQDKWNELHKPGSTIRMNDDDPARPENWFAAVWNYNAGFNPPGADSSGYWGLGWGNNPANPKYPADRYPFLDNNHYADAAHPERWSYEEKVMGWGAFPIDTTRSYDDNGNRNSGNTHGYSPAWWTSANDRSTAIMPPRWAFCDTSNACSPMSPPECKDEACYKPHWYTRDSIWKNCGPNKQTSDPRVNQCGNEYLTYKTVRSEPGDANPSPGPCGSGTLPSGTVLVDDLPDNVPSNRCGARAWSSSGAFEWSFMADDEGNYEAREDLHQMGGGFGGHYWFSHGREPNNFDNYLVTQGTWKPKLADKVYKVQAFMPYLGKRTKSAHYEVTTRSGRVVERIVDQSKNTNGWVDVGYFQLGSNAKVMLSNVTDDKSSGDTTVAYDALAFIPVNAKYEHHTFDAVSIFRSNQNLDTNTPWLMKTPMRTRQTLYDWAKSRTTGGMAFDKSAVLKGMLEYGICTNGSHQRDCVGQKVHDAARKWETDVDAAGTDPSRKPSQADWMGFAIADPPATINEHTFDDDRSYKIKTHIDAEWVTGEDGKIIPGTETVVPRGRTGDTEITPFVRAFVKATVDDYGSLGVRMPDLSFEMDDANEPGLHRSVPNPMVTGITPGIAYRVGKKPTSIDDSGKCVTTKYVSGGTIGYRPLISKSKADSEMDAWVSKLKSLAEAGSLPPEVANTAGDIYSMFFRKAKLSGSDIAEGSLFNMAGPIWQNVSMGFCTDGTVKSTQAVPNFENDDPKQGLVYQSYMPSLYLYLDGRMVDQAGRPTSGPVQNGNFVKFSEMASNENRSSAYGTCGVEIRGNGGNPWSLQQVPDGAPGSTPNMPMFCDDGSH